ncbi:site-specific integrase [Kineothrix sp. MSJ-39]|uniref:tyrosine-type recombinase/integrase n=1 Tax=Kineothrix sp. MSJ-39 TaxID=2841533 RepID=UPI001C0FEE18|nr:site-specific integrase [Kineothrix sp. MSJ-39]MBU5430906.1 site-specific integrase [Kineothrix sp. MSJ-39]
MGKSLNGKELGKGISQRKEDGLYIARFTNRFGKRQVISDKTYNGIQKKLREAIFADERAINVVNNNMTLDEWFVKWMDTCKKNCRNNTKDTYARHYKRVKKALGWRKLNKLNLVVMQDAINDLKTDNERRNSKKILVDMLDKALASDLITKNVAKQITTDVTREDKKTRRVLTVEETAIFLKEAEDTFYYNLFVVSLETGMRIGELSGLQWEDIDYRKKLIHVNHSMTYFSKDGKYIFELHPTKTNKGMRDIPLTTKAIKALKQQHFMKQTLVSSHREPMKGFENLVFVTKNNRPTTQFLVSECINGIIKKIHKNYPNLVFEKITPHCFRHTFATRWLEAQVPIKTVSAILGHSQLQLTTDLYMHVTQDSLFKGLEQYENIQVG